MANPLSQFITNRFLQPAVGAQVEKALTEKQPYAFGVGTVKETSHMDAIGQPHDAPYGLLYSLYRLNVDVSFGVRPLKGSATYIAPKCPKCGLINHFTYHPCREVTKTRRP